ncbi:hypothetical protein PLICRDRAFT_28927 [Plicaturopsis crispa FD-325 SS-3]|nr:hypothetical protein PLICRDRAFT_28927 [Plicaturopsis crispa FD-325 SS-3]
MVMITRKVKEDGGMTNEGGDPGDGGGLDDGGDGYDGGEDPEDNLSDDYEHDDMGQRLFRRDMSRERSQARSTRHNRGASRLPDDANTMVFEGEIFSRLVRLIRDRVGTQIVTPESKVFKDGVKLPAPYAGQDDIEVFDEWLNCVPQYLRLNKAGSPEYDVLRVEIAAGNLSGLAASWVNDEVTGPERVQRYWTFKNMIVAMHRRFIHQATARAATEKFYAVKFKKADGVVAFYNELKQYSSKMVHAPDTYIHVEENVHERSTYGCSR